MRMKVDSEHISPLPNLRLPTAAHVSFDTWVGSRTVAAVSSNVGSGELPFQSWRNFKEAFAPEIVERAIRETPGDVRHVIDPFGGSGTTALTSQFLGVKPLTIEVNPYLADLIEAKLTTYDVDAVAKEFAEVVAKVWGDKPSASPKFVGAPATFVEPGVSDKFIFTKEVAQRIVSYRQAIEAIDSKPIRRLLRVLLASTVVPVSNITVSGKGRRYRRQWRTNRPDPKAVDSLFRDGVLNALHDIRRYQDRACLDYKVLRGDARKLLQNMETVDLAVFSPPYPNSFDYTDVYNVELWSMGYITSSKDNRTLREATLRSHVQILRDLSSRVDGSTALAETLSDLEFIRADLWNRHIPSMVAAYFQDMTDILLAVRKRLSQRGRIYAVVGDSQYADVLVPTAQILIELANDLGLKTIAVEQFRSMRASPQQGGSAKLSENLVIFERV